MGEVTPTQWDAIQQGLKDIAVLSATMVFIRKDTDSIKTISKQLNEKVSSLKQIVKGSNGDYKTSVLGRLDSLEAHNKMEVENRPRLQLEKRKANIALITALLAFTASLIGFFITKP